MSLPTNDYIKRNKIPIISAVLSLIISFFIIDFSSISIWLFVTIILVYSIIFMFFYVLITSFINDIENDLIEAKRNKLMKPENQ
ncbi:MAG: hypothetical protein K2X69_09275 [Silvanigrellaceae bacterium]|nr:hypothetical protein [Silvanigrellaceae bacterium]